MQRVEEVERFAIASSSDAAPTRLFKGCGVQTNEAKCFEHWREYVPCAAGFRLGRLRRKLSSAGK
jgi:hypothetical protein